MIDKKFRKTELITLSLRISRVKDWKSSASKKKIDYLNIQNSRGFTSTTISGTQRED